MRRIFVFIAFMAMAGLSAATASAQVTPAAGFTPPDDTPVIRVGATIFGDYTYTKAPQSKDADGNLINPSAFNVSRSYINITGNVSHIVNFRITPDVTRVADASGTLSGNLVFRLKYAFAQVNLDDWMTRGSWVRFGIQQTPIVDYVENIYRYRFQGTVFLENANGAGALTSSDAGVSFHYNLPSNYGDIHVGFYNGEGYSGLAGGGAAGTGAGTADPNDQKAFQIRGTLRPFATMAPVLRGLRITGFYDGDNYIKDGEKKRAVFDTTFEHKFVNMGFDYLQRKDQTKVLPTPSADVTGSGWSFWMTPKSPMANGSSLEGLIRYEKFTPNTSDATSSQARKHGVYGIAMWFPHTGGPVMGVLLDYDTTKFDNVSPATPTSTKIGVHALVNF